MATVGVLCTRVRLEEKQIMTALAAAGVPALPLDPCQSPLPIGPVPPTPSAGEADGVAAGVIVDRCVNRAVAAAVLPVWRARRLTLLDAGTAATGDRLAVASALTAAGIPRPETRLVCSEASAHAALNLTGYPATLLPLLIGTPEIALFDQDTAEAILEHRHVLGATGDAIGLLQKALPLPQERVLVIVVGAHAVAVKKAGGQAARSAGAITMAEAAAAALGASIAGIEIALTAHGPVVWDVNPVPEFRNALALGQVSVAEAMAALAAAHVTNNGHLTVDSATAVRIATLDNATSQRREVSTNVALFA